MDQDALLQKRDELRKFNDIARRAQRAYWAQKYHPRSAVVAANIALDDFEINGEERKSLRSAICRFLANGSNASQADKRKQIPLFKN